MCVCLSSFCPNSETSGHSPNCNLNSQVCLLVCTLLASAGCSVSNESIKPVRRARSAITSRSSCNILFPSLIFLLFLAWVFLLLSRSLVCFATRRVDASKRVSGFIHLVTSRSVGRPHISSAFPVRTLSLGSESPRLLVIAAVISACRELPSLSLDVDGRSRPSSGARKRPR